jgi:hypothetical protein
VSTGPLSERINLLTEEWSSDLPLKFLWAVDIYGVTPENINAINDKYEVRRPGREWVTPNSATLDYYTSNKIGFLLAQNVNFPQDSFNVSNSGPNNGGFLPGYIGGVRSGYGGENNLGITFLETNIDFIDYFVRPWIIAASHKGLIDDGDDETNIKCKIDAYYFSRDALSSTVSPRLADRKLKLRKHFTFENCVPFQVEGDSLKYDGMDYNDLLKRVSFAFTHYYTNAIINQ